MKKYRLPIITAVASLVIGYTVGNSIGHKKGFSDMHEEQANQTLFLLSFSVSEISKVEQNMVEKIVNDHVVLLESSLQTAVELYAGNNDIMTGTKAIESMKRAAAFIRERPSLFEERAVIQISEEAMMNYINDGTAFPDASEPHKNGIRKLLRYVDDIPAPKSI